MKVEFKGLDSCKPRDLIRIKLGERTEWALVGSPGNEYLPVFVLSSDGTAHYFNVMGTMGCLKQKFEAPVLCYGQDYTLLPNHAGPCDLVTDASLRSEEHTSELQSLRHL